MRKLIGSFCISLGVICLLGAIGFIVYNRQEAEHAAEITQSLLQDVQLAIEEHQANVPASSEDGNPDAPQYSDPANTTNTPAKMATVKLDEYDCIGILSVPVLELDLPVLTDWSYAKLKTAPCLYYGSCYETDFVIAAHNYEAHFGRLSELQAGDIIIFTDAYGVAHYYEVALLETLPKEATLEMITSGFDLSLYTCTPGGSSRVTARCKAITP